MVKRGDSFYLIAHKLGVPLRDLLAANRDIHPARLMVGDVLFEPNEIRLMRRIVRDRKFRRTEADFTFRLWQSVRENEEKNIFPFVSDCKYSIDSTMPYEIGILKPHLKQALENIGEDSEFFSERENMLKKIRGVLSLPDTLIPEGSIYKEFV